MAKRAPKAHRTGVAVEASTPRLYRWFGAMVTPYVATRADDGTFTVLDEERWGSLLGAAEAHEIR